MNMDQQQEMISEARMELEPLIEQVEALPKHAQKIVIQNIKDIVEDAITRWEGCPQD